MTVVSMSYLLEAGVHFGHQTKRWNPKMKEYIFTARDDIYIIDLQKTSRKLEEAYKVLYEIAKEGGKVLFVGTKKQAQEASKEEAIRSNMYYVIERWLGGTLTNFKTIRRRIGRLSRIEAMEEDGTFDLLPKKEVIKIRKEYEKLDKNLSGIREMKQLPEALIIVDPRKELNAIKEARKLKIPVFGIVDTNCDPDDVDYVIPANDDAIRSVKLVLGVLNNAIVEANGGELVNFLVDEDKIKNSSKVTKETEPIVIDKVEPKIINEQPVIEEPKEKVVAEVETAVVEKTTQPKKEDKVEKTAPKEIVKPKKEKIKEDLSKFTVAELKEKAKAAGIVGYSKLRKEELIQVLQ